MKKNFDTKKTFFFDEFFFKVHLQNQENRFEAVSERFLQYKPSNSPENQKSIIIFHILGGNPGICCDPMGWYFKKYFFSPIHPHAKSVVSPSSEGIRGPYGTLVYHQSVILDTRTVFITVGASQNNSGRFLEKVRFFPL